MGGWSRGFAPPQEHCKLPPTYFWTTLHQTRASLISVNNIKVIFLAGLTILKEEGIVGGCGGDPAVAFRLMNNADYRLSTFGPHGTKLEHSLFQWKMKRDFFGRFDNSKKETLPGILSTCRGDPVVAFRLMNNADYLLSTFGPHGTKLENSWFQWKMKTEFSGRVDNSEKGDASVLFQHTLVIPCLHSAS